MVKIPITEAMILKAREMEAEVLGNLKSTPNYTGLYAKDRFYNGFLGELVFEQFLIQSNISYKYQVNLDGNSQGADFIISLHRDLAVEVKNSGNENARMLLINEKQFNHRTFDLYIGMKTVNNTGEIYGYCFKDQFKFKPDGFTDQKLPTYYLELLSLYPIENLHKKSSKHLNNNYDIS